MNQTRASILLLCHQAGAEGYQPKGGEWITIYWLHARGMLTALREHRAKAPRFAVTPLGTAALEHQEALA